MNQEIPLSGGDYIQNVVESSWSKLPCDQIPTWLEDVYTEQYTEQYV